MTSITLIRSSALYAGAPYAYAATAPAGSRLIFLAGAALANLETALDAAGATLADVISTRVLVASSDRSDLTSAWDVVQAGFGDHDAPSTLLGVTVLGYAEQLVEIEAVAVVAPVARPTFPDLGDGDDHDDRDGAG